MTQRCKRAIARTAAWWLVLAWSAVGLIHARSLEDIQQSGEIRVCLSPIHPFIVKAEPEGGTDDCAFSGAVMKKSWPLWTRSMASSPPSGGWTGTSG